MRFLVLRPVLTLTVAAVYLRVFHAAEWRELAATCRELNLQIAREERA
ncbi:MAG TPA: hypothetical protein VNJ54_15190 [Plantibacter sp.]|nr:hypothetical protein [Plantibacter sp.]